MTEQEIYVLSALENTRMIYHANRSKHIILRWSGQEVGVVYCGCVRKWVLFCFAVGYMFYSISRYCP